MHPEARERPAGWRTLLCAIRSRDAGRSDRCRRCDVDGRLAEQAGAIAEHSICRRDAGRADVPRRLVGLVASTGRNRAVFLFVGIRVHASAGLLPA